jgi:hypothetical protein
MLLDSRAGNLGPAVRFEGPIVNPRSRREDDDECQ